jgi:hypothetical protein
MSDSGDLVGGLIGLALIVIAVVIVLYLIYLALHVLVAGGALFGAGISLRNYALAFRNNVRPERVTS